MLSTTRSRPVTRRLSRAIGGGIAVGALAAATLVAGPAIAQVDDDEVPWSTAHSPATVVGQMTGVDGTTDTAERWAIVGTDLGVMWDDGRGGVLTALGDTFGIWPPTPAGGGGGGDWRSNVLLRSTDRDLSDGMSFDWALEDRPGHAAEFIPSQKIWEVEGTTIPTAGIEIGGVQYVGYMSIPRWGAPGLWDTNFSRIAYSEDGGLTWNTTDGPTWYNPGAEISQGDHPFQMLGFEKHEGWLYMFGTPNGRAGAAHVARVAEADVLDQSAYEYWTGAEWETGEGADRRAAPIIEPMVSELSVKYDDWSGKWLITYLDQDLDVVLRTADSPTGPWAPKQVMASFADYPALYGSYFHPWSPDGELYFALSQWVPYNVYLMHVSIDQDGNIVRPNLVADAGFERHTVPEGNGYVPVEEPWMCAGNCGVDNRHEWAYAGSRNAWVRGTTGTHAVTQEVAVEPNTSYEAQAWLYASPTTVDGGLDVMAADGSVLGSTQVETLGDWTRVSVSFESGPHAAVVLSAGITASGLDTWMRVDDVSLNETDGTDPEPEPAPYSATVAARCMGTAGRLLLEVTATNDSDTAVRMRVHTDTGSRSLGVVRPGDSRTGVINTGGSSVEAGSLRLEATPLGGGETEEVWVDHEALSCR